MLLWKNKNLTQQLFKTNYQLVQQCVPSTNTQQTSEVND